MPTREMTPEEIRELVKMSVKEETENQNAKIERMDNQMKEILEKNKVLTEALTKALDEIQKMKEQHKEELEKKDREHEGYQRKTIEEFERTIQRMKEEHKKEMEKKTIEHNDEMATLKKQLQNSSKNPSDTPEWLQGILKWIVKLLP